MRVREDIELNWKVERRLLVLFVCPFCLCVHFFGDSLMLKVML